MGAPELISSGSTAGVQAFGAIKTLTLTTAGTSGTAGNYREQALTNITGSGSGATADINVSAGGVVTILGLRSPGTGYAVGNTLSAAIAGLTGAVFTVAAITTSDNFTGNVTANRIAAGSTNPTAGIVTNAGFVSTTAPLIMSSSFSGGTTQYRTGMLVNMDGETLFQSSLTASESSVATGIGVVGRWNLSARTTNTTVNGLHGYSSIAAPGSAGCTSIGAQCVSLFSGAAFTGTTSPSNMANGIGVYAQVQAQSSIGANVFQTFYAYDALLSCAATTVQTINNAGYLVARPAIFSGAAHTIGAFYGVYLPTPTLSGGAAITTRYGVFQQDPAATNQFAGTVQFNNGFGSVATVYGQRAWVNFNGTGVVAIRGSGNVSTITDLGVGSYSVNFTTAMPDVNYSAHATVGYDGTVGSGIFASVDRNSAAAAVGSVRVYLFNTAFAVADSTMVFVSVTR